MAHSRSGNSSKQTYELEPRVNQLLPVFGSRPADSIKKNDIISFLQGPRGWFPAALEEAMIEGYTWHCNRHTFASRLVMAGVDLHTVAELLGHRTLQMVMRYSHLAPEHQASAVVGWSPFRNGKDTRTDTEAKCRKRSPTAMPASRWI